MMGVPFPFLGAPVVHTHRYSLSLLDLLDIDWEAGGLRWLASEGFWHPSYQLGLIGFGLYFLTSCLSFHTKHLSNLMLLWFLGHSPQLGGQPTV